MQSVNIFTDAYCSSPVYLEGTATTGCVASDCTSAITATGSYYTSTTCPTSAFANAAEIFGSTGYLLVEAYLETTCETSYTQAAYLASGECVTDGSGAAVIATLFTNGSAALLYFLDSACSVSIVDPIYISENLLTSHTCYAGSEYYSSSGGAATNGVSSGSTVTASSGSIISASSGSVFGTSSTSGTTTTDGSGSSGSSGVSVGLIAGIAGGFIVLLLLLLGCCCCWRRRRNRSKEQEQGQAHVQVSTPVAFEQAVSAAPYRELPQSSKAHTTTASSTLVSSDGAIPSKLWDDEAIIAARIPREKVIVGRLINRGGFGEVYAGTYNGQRVAVKMLLPERKKSLAQVNAFLSEVKLMTTLEHQHIVQFIGVAWDSLTDLCVVTEYMVIDLKALLTKFDEQRLPTGFDHDKVKVALHVAHALTYLHSCAPPVIHRDLKSSNILLSETMDAKVTDFGISRERIDATMTAGVGTSLWMAPEVMMGERYDDKADMFSFGVVLSELDLHTLPYKSAKVSSTSGQKVPDAAILQMVAMGRLRVEFSGNSPRSMLELGLACVSIEPKQRPSAAEALYQLQKILANEL
jgi:serine/threonine-protein kinase TNNI3K